MLDINQLVKRKNNLYINIMNKDNIQTLTFLGIRWKKIIDYPNVKTFTTDNCFNNDGDSFNVRIYYNKKTDLPESFEIILTHDSNNSMCFETLDLFKEPTLPKRITPEQKELSKILYTCSWIIQKLKLDKIYE